jgi:hypothetical protein
LGSTSKPGRRIGSGCAWLPSARIVQRRVSKPGVFGSASGEKSKTMRRPPGDQDGASWMPGPEVMTCRSLPSGLAVAICSSPSGWKKSNAMRRPSARQSEKKPGRSLSTRTCVPSGCARKSGKPRPVSKSRLR